MKYLLIITTLSLLGLYSCGSGEEKEITDDEPKIDLPYEKGGAETPKAYFEGLAGHLNRVDAKLKYILSLDQANVSADSIHTELDSILLLTDEDKKIIHMYDQRDWPEKDSLQELTLAWYGAVEMLVNDHFKGLAEPFSRPDDSWTEQDKELYYAYETAYFDVFYAIDKKWVDFQDVFTKANNLKFDDDEPGL